jgi:hypothetical protein
VTAPGIDRDGAGIDRGRAVSILTAPVSTSTCVDAAAAIRWLPGKAAWTFGMR